jgi:hypothetical protein
MPILGLSADLRGAQSAAGSLITSDVPAHVIGTAVRDLSLALAVIDLAEI